MIKNLTQLQTVITLGAVLLEQSDLGQHWLPKPTCQKLRIVAVNTYMDMETVVVLQSQQILIRAGKYCGLSAHKLDI